MAWRKADDVSAKLAGLQAQVNTLMRDRITPAMASAADSAQSAARGAADAVTEQAGLLSNRVRSRPMIAVLSAALIAAGLGFAIGRLMR